MAEALSGSVDSAADKPGVLGLLFLKYIAGAFVAKQAESVTQWPTK